MITDFYSFILFQVVALTTANLQQKVDFLDSIPSSSVAATTRDIIVGMPTILNLSVQQNLRPKVEYLRERLGDDVVVGDMIHKLPTLLGYSLQNRIIPRMEAILAAGVDGMSLTVGIPMSQVNFEKWLIGRARKANAQRDPPPMLILPPAREVDNRTEAEKQGRVMHWKR